MTTSDKQHEDKVLKRYIELAGLVKDRKMVNRDKEQRAREDVITRDKFLKMVIEQNQFQENSRYGKFILQTNEVQYYLGTLILVRSGFPDKDYSDYVQGGAELGTLINLFNACSKDLLSAPSLIPKLKEYNKKRNRLAHKMQTDKKLTIKECDETTKEGEKILEFIKVLLKDEIGDFEKK